MKILKPPLVFLAIVAFLAIPMFAVAEGKGKSDLPTANGKDLWNYLQQVKYRESFTLWPGKGKLYKGREPHGALLTTYVNEYALSAIQGKKGTMPAESIIVKENYKPDKTLAAITVMYKVVDFNPTGGNWFWVKYAPDGKVLAEGKPNGCISCHGQKKDNDWIFTGELK